METYNYNRTIGLQIYQGKAVGFLAQEETQYIQAIRTDAKVMLCPGTILVNSQILVPIILFQLGNDTIYMASFNYHENSERQCFESLLDSNDFYLVFYNEARHKSRRIAVANALSGFFRRSREFIVKLPAWSSVAFEEARATIRREFRAADLWQQFSQGWL